MRMFKAYGLLVVSIVCSVATAANRVEEALKDMNLTGGPGCELALAPMQLFKSNLNDENLSFAGMTPEGQQRLLKAQEDLKLLTANFNNTFEAMDSQLEVYLVAMASGHNVMSTGGPGGAKSASLLWLITNLWVKQVHEMLTDVALIGGQTEEGLKRGVEDINTDGSLIQAAFAMLDEVNNANPQLLATVLSLMNPGERFIYVNGKRVVSQLRSVFTTSNATRYEMVQMFKERGMQSGDAFLNRSLFKLLVPNWLNLNQQYRRDVAIKRRNRLKSIVKYGTLEAAKLAAEQLKPTETRSVNWDVVDAVAEQAFEASPALENAARALANSMRQRMNAEIKKSEATLMDGSNEFKAIFTPSAEWTERLRGEILRVVKYSAALDYIRTQDVSALNKPIELSALSLWRAYSIATTVGSGVTRFNAQTMTMEYNLVRDMKNELVAPDRNALKAETKDLRSEKELEHMFMEQDIFNEELKKALDAVGETGASKAKFF